MENNKKNKGVNTKNFTRKDNTSFKKKYSSTKKNFSTQKAVINPDYVRLNKYLANSGICSRREADQLIASGAIKVNGKIVTEMGYKVHVSDQVHVGEQKVHNEKKVYILLNKPKDYLTTTKDPKDRKTVFNILENACKERVYPVGRMDKLSSGVLLLTNDGDLTKKLTSAKTRVVKMYHVELDKNFKKEDFIKLKNGIKIDDVEFKVNDIQYVEDSDSKKHIGIEIHTTKNGIIRKIMEKLGYQVLKLDRVMYAGLSKKGLRRGEWRFLKEKELIFLNRL